MTPAARVSAAIELLDRIQSGELADRALADWGRKNRYAGSKDRAAIGDIVYDVLRRKRSLSALGGGHTGRSLLLGYVRELGQDPEGIFGSGPYAPSALSEKERSQGSSPRSGSGEDLDIPEWLWPDFQSSMGDNTRSVALALRARAPVQIRVNLSRLSRDSAVSKLADEGIETRSNDLSASALDVVNGARRIRNCQLYLNGGVELQDASSQAVADLVPLQTDQTLLDFCAGGGGKTLAVGARVSGAFFAHDADLRRMKDLPQRARRAGLPVTLLTQTDLKTSDDFDSVLIDAPCSGSGSWRRDPQGKWVLTQEKLNQTVLVQKQILEQAKLLVKPHGHLIYATCSLLEVENNVQVCGFLDANPDFSMVVEKKFTPLDGGDGFYCSVLQKTGS